MQLSPGRARGAPRRHPGGHRRRGPQDDLLPRSQAARVLVVIDVVGEMLARVHVPPPLAVEKTPLMPVTRTARCASNGEAAKATAFLGRHDICVKGTVLEADLALGFGRCGSSRSG